MSVHQLTIQIQLINNGFSQNVQIRKMGCQPSKRENNQTEVTLSSVEQDFKINYKQFVRNDMGSIFSFYHFSKILNRSSSSLVRKVIHRISKIQRVCKIVPMQKWTQIIAMRQVQNLRHLDHPNIVQIQEYFFDKTYLYIIMQSIQGVKLSQFLLNNTSCSLDALVKLFQQLLSAINYCHHKGLVHNLVHPDNVMVIERENKYFLKLIDFSQSGCVNSPKINDIDFPPQYQLFRDPQSTKSITPVNDIWSCAVLFLFMISGEKNFKDFNQHKIQIITEKVNCFDIQKKTEGNVVDLLMRMLDGDVGRRLKVEECLRHEVFVEFRQEVKGVKQRKRGDSFLLRLMQFRVSDNLHSVFCMYTSLNLLSSTQKCEYMTQFCNLDSNRDGKLDRSEIKQGLLNTFPFTDHQADDYVSRIFLSIDKNNNQYLEYSQFVMATAMISRRISEEELERIFKEIDINQDGEITEEEVAEIVGGGFRGVGRVMRGKRKINMEEFKAIMMEMFHQGCQQQS